MKTITGIEMRDRLLLKLHVPVKFERCEDDYGWMTEVHPQQYREIHEWCEQNFTHGDWYSGIYYVWVKDKKMALWFTLRWS